MTLFRRVTEISRERLPSIRVARITIDSIFDLDSMLQPGIRFGVTVRNTSELVGTPIASMVNFFFEVDVMDGDEKWIIQRMSHWLNGTFESFYRIFYNEVCVTRLDGVDGEELGWRNAYDVFQLNNQIESEWEKKAGVYNLTENVPPTDDFYTLSVMSTEAQYAPTHIPVGVRKEGLIITFRSHSEWETWQFSDAGDFIAAGNWKRIDPFIEQGVYDMDQQSPLLRGQYYQCSNDDDDYYIPSSIPVGSRVAFMKVRYINSYGKRVILRYALSDFAYFHNYDYWDVLKVSDLSSADIEGNDFLNLTEKVPPIAAYYLMKDNISEYRKAYKYVPEEYRAPGTTITFKTDTSWEIWQFIGTDITTQWNNLNYWLERSNYTLTKAAIEEHLTGHIISHTHPSSNYVLDSSSSHYGYYVMEQDAPMQASKSVPAENRFRHLTISFQTQTKWESWQFIGTDVATQWNDLDYWIERSNYTLTKAAIEEELVGHITTHTHGITNLTPSGTVTPLLDAINAVPASNRVYGHMVTFKDEQFGWQLWRFIGTNISTQFTNKEYWERIDTPEDETSVLPEDQITVSNYIQIGSARLQFIEADIESGTPAYLKLLHSDGETEIHLVTSGGQTMFGDSINPV